VTLSLCCITFRCSPDRDKVAHESMIRAV